MNPNRTARPTGFTLIEILFSIMAIAILLIALYGIFSRATRLRNEAVERTRQVRLRARAAAVIRDDLRHAMVTGGRMAAGLEGGASGPDSRFPGYLRLTTLTGPNATNAFFGDLQEVQYYVGEDPWSTNADAGVLLRSLDRNLLAQVRTITREERVLDQVRLLEVSFYDGDSWVDGWEYVDIDSPLPAAIRVTLHQLATGEDSPPPRPLEVLVPWDIIATNLTASATNSADAEEGAAPEDGGSGGGGGGGGGAR